MKSWLHVAALILFIVLSSVCLLAKGRDYLQTGSVSEYDRDADGTVDSLLTLTNGFDRRGRLVQSVFTGRYGGDGSMDYVQTAIYTWSSGNRLSTAIANTVWSDGRTDRSTTTYDNTDPNEFRQVMLDDRGANGSVDYTSTSIYSFDHREGVELMAEEFYDNLNDSVIGRFTTYITNDRPHHLVIYASDYDFDGDGLIDASSKETFTLGARGEIISGFREDFDAGWRVVSTVTTTYTYDRDRNPEQIRMDFLFAGPTGPRHDVFTTTYFYASRGEFSTATQRSDLLK